MLLVDVHGGSSADLRPAGAASKWVTVAGEVSVAEGSWSFICQCLTIPEARSVPRWLVKAAGASSAGAARHRLLDFAEPNLAFGCARRGGELVVAVHFSHESAPPWAQGRRPYMVSLAVDGDVLEAAAVQWRKELAAVLSW